MRCVRQAPWFRVALLVMAVLLAHTGRAATRVLLFRPPCLVKVATGQPEPEKTFPSAVRRALRSRNAPPAGGHNPYADAAFLPAHARAFQLAQASLRVPGTDAAASIAPQFRRFVLRL